MEEELYITKKQVVKIISDYLEPLMTENNFKFIKSKDAFIKKTNFGYLKILININSFWPLKQELNISISVINYKINEIKMLFFSNTKRDNLIIYNWLVLPNSNELKYKELYTLQDIEIAKQEAFNLIKNDAFTYLKKYSDLENITEYCKDSYLNIALISAKLFNQSVYTATKNHIKKSDIFKKSDSDYINNIEKLIKYLDEM